MTEKTGIQFILLDDFDDIIDTFDDIELLEDYIEYNYDEEEAEDLRVLEVNKEYIVNLKTETEVILEEI